MSTDASQKVTASHLKRSAYLYVRQSTMRQVFENTESTQRQYGLRQRAIALGWPQDRVIVIDTDLGQSGASAADRAGFQQLVADVGLGRAGIVLGLEVSRLARNSTDWHRLLEICALTDTLILDSCEVGRHVESTDSGRAERADSSARLHITDRGLQRFQPVEDRRVAAPGGTARHRQVERAQYDADRARHRYMQVDPANRLVADSLEADWNGRLRALAEAQEEYQRQRTADRVTVDTEHRERILALAVDFPAIWRDPNTPQQERKRMLALLVEDVTLLKQRQVTAHVRFRGGATTTLTLPRPLTAWELRATSAETRQQMNALLDEYTDAHVAAVLNERGLRTGAGEAFDAEPLAHLVADPRLEAPLATPPTDGGPADAELGGDLRAGQHASGEQTFLEARESRGGSDPLHAHLYAPQQQRPSDGRPPSERAAPGAKDNSLAGGAV